MLTETLPPTDARAEPEARPDISIVMPSFNQAEFLPAAIHSVMSQPGPRLELVVMDGGSTDGSQAVLAQMSAAHPGRIRWWSGPDGGPAEAITEAVRRAHAELIGWLNSDDLYSPGAVARAVDHLRKEPGHVMVYGEGEHVDLHGVWMERYPTQPPSVPFTQFLDGCFICQPTAFFRRDAFLALGGLDTSLKAAFDFEMWLRMFKAHPQGIGFIPSVQAQSRLHAGGITLRFRERVAMEGMQVIARHVGPPPSHWLLTHFGELCDQHPFFPERLDLRERCLRLIDRASVWLEPQAIEHLHQRLAQDPRIRLASADAHVAIHEDGWAADPLELRLWQGPEPVRAWRLSCRHHAPMASRLRVEVSGPDGETECWQIDGNGPFELEMPVRRQQPGAQLRYQIRTEGAFVPAEVEPGSTDRRSLAFRVDGLLLER